MVGDDGVDFGVCNNCLRILGAKVRRRQNDPARKPVKFHHREGGEKLRLGDDENGARRQTFVAALIDAPVDSALKSTQECR